MQVDLRTLQPNPFRDFRIDPIDETIVEVLRQSIAEDGFWGGIVCRQVSGGTLQIGAGHHRVRAALAAGVTHADLFVGEAMDDATMVRVYARENATQRGSTSTALTGTVAAAMKYVAKSILTGIGVAGEISRNFDLPTLRRRLLSDDGMGWRVVLAFLCNIPGINEVSVRHQLANIKTSGDYARLIADVEQEIIAEAAAAQAAHEQAQREHDARKRAEAEQRKAQTAHAATQARQAAQKAAERVKTFDFEGVAAILKNPHQVDVFREIVTNPAVKPYLAVEDQAELAQRIVAYITEQTTMDLSGHSIKQGFNKIWMEERERFRGWTREQEAKLKDTDLHFVWKRAMSDFQHHLTELQQAGQTMLMALQEWPTEESFPPVSVEFRAALHDATIMMEKLNSERRFHYA